MISFLQKCCLSSYIGPDLLKEAASFKPFAKAKSKKGKLLALQGEEVLFGIHPVTLALNKNRRVMHQLFIADDKMDREVVSNIEQLAEKRQLKIEKVPKQALDQAVGNAAWNPTQGVILDCGKLPVKEINNETDFRPAAGPIVPIFVNIIDPMNIGAILRSAHFFGCKSVIITSDCSRLSPVVSKASSGAMEVLQIDAISQKLLLPFMKWQREMKATIIATTGNENDNIGLENIVGNCSNWFVLFGNEGRGLPRAILNEADHRVTIPQPSQDVSVMNSLNVSVACGIFLYQLTRNKNK